LADCSLYRARSGCCNPAIGNQEATVGGLENIFLSG
jgi:hypothetical protein